MKTNKQKQHLLGNYAAKLQTDGFFLGFPRKKLVFHAETNFSLGKKTNFFLASGHIVSQNMLVFRSKTMFFVGKCWFSMP